MAREAGNKTGLMFGLLDLGIDSVQLREHGRARLELAEALQVSRELGADWNCAYVFDTLADISCDEEDFGEARALHLRALAIRLALGQRSGVAECLSGLAEVAVATGDVARAARIYGAAEALREEVGASSIHYSRQRYARFAAAGRARLGDAAWEEATREGRGLTLEQAVALERTTEPCIALS